VTAQARIDKPRYAGKVALRQAVNWARELGLDVAGFEMSPDGTIRIMEARAVPQQPESLYDQLKADGKLG